MITLLPFTQDKNDFFYCDENQSFTYNQFFLDLEFCLHHPIFLKSSNRILIKTGHPYYFFLSFLTLILLKKSPTVISNQIKELELSGIKEDYFFDAIFNPLDTKSLIQENNIKQNSKSLDKYFLDLNQLNFQIKTSGSTHKNKIYTFDLENAYQHVQLFHTYFKILKPSFFLNLPLNHVSGLMILFRAFFLKGTIYSFSIENFKNIDFLSLVPSQVSQFLKEEKLIQCLQNTKHIFIGGAALSTELKDELIKKNINFIVTYGMTETLSFIALNGKLLKSITALTIENRLLIQSPTLAKYIWKNNIATKDHLMIKDGSIFFKSEDEVELIFPEKIIFKKRHDQIINSGGIKISKDQLDFQIKSFNLFDDFHIIKIKHPKWGENTVLFYQLKAGITIEIDSFLKANLPPYHSPIFNIPYNFSNDSAIKRKYNDFYFYFLETIFPFKFHIGNKKRSTLLITFHGLFESSSDYEFLNNEFPEIHQLHIDLPGSPINNFFQLKNYEECLFYLAEFITLKTANFNDVYILAYSQGGRVALNLLPFNIKFKEIFIVSSSFGLNSLDEIEKRKHDDSVLLNDINSTDDLRAFFIKWYQNPLFTNYNNSFDYNEKLNAIKYEHLNHYRYGLRLLSQSVFPLFNKQLENTFPHMNKLTYFVGNDDLKYLEIALKVKNKSNEFKLIKIKGAGHKLIKTHRDDFISYLKSFLNFRL